MFVERKHYPLDDLVCDCMLVGDIHCAYHGRGKKPCWKGQYSILHIGTHICEDIKNYFMHGKIIDCKI